jgi:phosphomannomutase
MMARHGKRLSELVQDLYQRYGPHDYHRIDVHTSEEAKAASLRSLDQAGGLSQIAGDPVRSLDRLDGYKHRLDDAWLLIRPSGTEPVLRIYSEARGETRAEAYVRDAIAQLGL